jgi:uncharacterized protein involved in cysteine biosynthesis
MNNTIQALAHGFQDAIAPRNFRYFLYSLLIVVAAAVGLYLLLYGAVSEWLTQLDASEGWLFWMVGVVIHALLGVLGYFLVTPVILLVVSLFSEQIANNIRTQRYPALPTGTGIELSVSTILMGKVFGKYLIGLLFASPLLLMGIGYLLYLILGYLLFRRLLLIEVLGMRMGVSQIEQQAVLGGAGRYRLTTLLLYLLSLIPLANLFVPYMAVCVITNESMANEEKGL